MITKKDNIWIKNIWESKGYGAQRVIHGFSDKNRKRRGIENLLESCKKLVR